MIYVRLTGGLGNQLFQLAAGQHLQEQTGQELRMFIEHLSNYDRPYPFMLNEALNGTLQLGKPPRLVETVSRYRLNKVLKGFFPWYISNNNINHPLKKGYYLLDDYFQDISVIRDNVISLSKTLASEAENNPLVQDRLDRFANGYRRHELAAIHIRRADYLSPKNRKVFCYLDNGYYERAIRQLPASVKRLVVFSESAEEDLSSITDKEIVYVNGSGLSAVQEFFIMSRFSNIIIGNSTFSFWSSLLPKTEEGIRIGPRNWTFIAKDANTWYNNLRSFSYTIVE